MKRLPFLLSVLLLLIDSSVAQAGAQLSFTYQGLLKEGGALVNGTIEMTATIYDDQNEIVSQQVRPVIVRSGSYAMTIDNIDLAKVVAADNTPAAMQLIIICNPT